MAGKHTKSKAEQRAERRKAKNPEEPRKPGSASVGFEAMRAKLEGLGLPELPNQAPEDPGPPAHLHQHRRGGLQRIEIIGHRTYAGPPAETRYHEAKVRRELPLFHQVLAATEGRELAENAAIQFSRSGVGRENEPSVAPDLAKEILRGEVNLSRRESPIFAESRRRPDQPQEAQMG
jgi:hypothetical protein